MTVTTVQAFTPKDLRDAISRLKPDLSRARGSVVAVDLGDGRSVEARESDRPARWEIRADALMSVDEIEHAETFGGLAEWLRRYLGERCTRVEAGAPSGDRVPVTILVWERWSPAS